MKPESFFIKCNDCGAKNRIPRNRLKDRPLCGRCRSPLPPLSVYDRPVIVTDHTFHNEIILSPGASLVDCWAPWCSTCSMITPVLVGLAKKYAGKAKIAKLNVDENPMTSSKYHIQSVPTLLFFKNGEKVNRMTGGYPGNEIERQLLAIM